MMHCSLPWQNIYTGNLILVNPSFEYHMPKNVDLVSVPNSNSDVWLERCAATALNVLLKKICGWDKIVPVSGWRSLREQQTIWDDTLTESGLEFTQKYVAVPGHSEHQTGLAIDLGRKQKKIDFICPEFPYDGICETFRSHAADYGFIERYPSGKETITGIGHEPWHFRYVGVPHAALIKELDFTLEEYIDFIKGYPFGIRPYHYTKNGLPISVSYLKAVTGRNTEFELNTKLPCSISGNNIDGFIITEWRESK